MRKAGIVRLLNEDLSGEIEAILTYMRNSFVTESCKPSRSMEEIARDEMRHAEMLAEMIVDLGGVPAMLHRELDFGRKGPAGSLRRLIALEEKAIGQYREHIRLITDTEVRKKLGRILQEEEDHLAEFRSLLAAERKTLEK